MRKSNFIILLFFVACGGNGSDSNTLDNVCLKSTQSCQKGQFCDFETSQCGEVGDVGVCKIIPEVCAEIYSPVCGCDGVTYTNACFANGVGVSTRSEGACQ